MRQLIRYLKNTLNPSYALSPLLLRSVSVDEMPSPIGPIVYLPAETIDCQELPGMPVTPHMSHLQEASHSSMTATVRVLENLIYVAECTAKNLLLSPQRKFISESSSTMKSTRSFRWQNARRPVCKSYKGLNMVFRGVSNNFYHALIDNLPRLMALSDTALGLTENVRLLIPGKLSGAEAALLELVLPDNVEVEIIEAGKSYHLERCLFATFATRQFSGFVPSAYLDWLGKHVLPQRERKANRLIYISRQKAPKRRLLNEDEMIACVKGYGFEVFNLEDLSLSEQIELFYDAKCVIGLHGAGFANLVFSSGLQVIELFPYQWVKPSYYFLTKAVGGHYHYVVGEGDEINVDVALPVNLVRERIEGLTL